MFMFDRNLSRFRCRQSIVRVHGNEKQTCAVRDRAMALLETSKSFWRANMVGWAAAVWSSVRCSVVADLLWCAFQSSTRYVGDATDDRTADVASSRESGSV